MQINFEEDNMLKMQAEYNKLSPQTALFMSHYELAAATSGYTAEEWKQFMMNPQVSAWITQELELFKEYQLKQMIRTATDNDRSVGAAQMINSLTKTLSDGKTKEGPIIIYTHVPLTQEQEDGTSVEVRKLKDNIFDLLPRR